MIMMILEKEKLQNVLQAFYTLTKVRIAVYDEWQNELACYPTNLDSFCQTLRLDKEMDERCRLCDKNAFATVERTEKQYAYTCHMGLRENLYPIVHNGRRVGFLMIGQFLQKGDSEKLREKIDNCQGDCDSLYREMKNLQVLDKDHTDSIATIMAICAEYLCFNKMIAPQETKFAEKFERYISQHVHETVSVQQLTEHFKMSRTALYQAVKKDFGMSVTQYVNNKKIQIAMEWMRLQIPTNVILERLYINDANYFYRMFKQHAGMSVHDYKKSLLE
ncbi:MAG: PocR ligand-binding domain-containing protein [Clostridia bacterium]|nr:PocR ligand-binding domain-containing protein [Clostridia bacterium]